MDAVEEFLDRCECWVKDGNTSVDEIMQGAFDDESDDWFHWDLIDKYISMPDLIEHFEDEYREALFNDVRERVEEMVEDQEEEDDEY